MNIQYDTPLTGLGGYGEGCEQLLSFHMSFTSACGYSEVENVRDKRRRSLRKRPHDEQREEV